MVQPSAQLFPKLPTRLRESWAKLLTNWGILDFVGDAGGKGAEGGELGLGDQFFLRAPQLLEQGREPVVGFGVVEGDRTEGRQVAQHIDMIIIIDISNAALRRDHTDDLVLLPQGQIEK